MPSPPIVYSATRERYDAAHQCDWVDAQLAAAHGYGRAMQYDILVTGSAQGRGRLALAASQVPRCMVAGMQVAGAPALAVRDITVAVSAALFDEGMVLPLWRLGRFAQGLMGGGPNADGPRPFAAGRAGMRLPSQGGLGTFPGPPPEPTVPLMDRLGDVLVLLSGLGGSLAAVPLNAAVLLASIAGAAMGLGAGLIAALVAACIAPAALTRALSPGLATLVALTDSLVVVTQAQEALPTALPSTCNRAQLGEALEVFEATAVALAACKQRLGPGQSLATAATPALALEQACLASARLAWLLGMPHVPHGRIEYIVAALRAHQRHYHRTQQAFDALDVFEDAHETLP